MNHASLLLVLALTPLSAGEGLRFGAVGGPANPMGELRHNDPLGTHSALGGHLGLVLQGRLNPNNELRGQLTYLAFPGRGSNSQQAWPDYSNLQSGLDWVHGFTGLDRGGYLVVGATVNRFHRTSIGPFPSGPGAPSRTQTGALGGKVGGGFAFSPRFRLEGQFNQVQIKRNGPDGLDFTPAQWIQASAIFQF